jgi:hypothetical protein
MRWTPAILLSTMKKTRSGGLSEYKESTVLMGGAFLIKE